MNKEIEKLQEIIDDSENIVFFGGAGVSTESNIPDFRSADGCLTPCITARAPRSKRKKSP